MAKLAELRKQAKELGIAPSAIRSCNTAAELQTVIKAFGASDEDTATATKPRKKSAVAKKKARKSGNSKSASKKSAPAAKSAKSGKAKRPTTKGTDGPSGRNLLSGVDFSSTDGWTPRDGSPPDRIVKALKRFKGNRGKVFDHLSGDIWEFVGKKNAKGEKRSKADAEAMLRYRISRTAFDFAVRTGQHEPSENRVTYGTGDTGTGAFKRKGNSKKAAAKPKASKKATSKKPAKRPTKATSGKGSRTSKSKKRGRPKGSKNKKA